ncbi:lysophospholipid acyltransferase 6 isoform X2 [Phymastichus coffea]|uniref:lysophospholipid acyltransferase 6 isoform X2 n=1 Tax=Phymastichus coffea TaxID=108790 RepID=UPI00273AE2F9|nr:lysophospholipid acyltransferase 6 isoform X2 [Phymastichus coffea]
MAVATEDFYYDGFRTFSWLSELVDIPIDQVNFLITQFTALGLAGLLRSPLNPVVASPASRHAFGLVIGLVLGYFNFGKVVLAVALIYLSCIHFHRQMYDYGSCTLDVTAPLMVITQKVTSLAYSVHDGLTRKEDELTPSQRYYAVQKMPTVLEYFSYVFQFQALMAGPIIFYRDYIDFIHGRGQKLFKSPYDEQSTRVNEIVLEPSLTPIVVKKVIASLLCAVIFVQLIPSYPIEKIKDDEFLYNTSTAQKYWYLIVSTMLIRFKYYHAWLFADAICNCSGLGFNGYNEDGTARWDLVSNVDAFKFETALSLKDSIDAWNKGTNRWLRMIVYDRVKHNKTILTYSLSALWHGFYPGYYLTFANGAFFTVAARTVRRHVRPYFLTSKTKKVFYDALTLVTTRLILTYITFSFILLEFQPSITLYLTMFLAPHLLGMSAILVLPMMPKACREVASHKHNHHARHEKAATLLHAAHHHNSSQRTSASNGHVHKGK